MKTREATVLLQLLANKELKTKNVSGADYVNLLNVKRQIKRHLEKLGEAEQAIAEDYKVTVQPNTGQWLYPDDFKEKQAFLDKITEARKTIGDPSNLVLNFMDQKDFLEFTKELDIDASTGLAEWILKGEEPKLKLNGKEKTSKEVEA